MVRASKVVSRYVEASKTQVVKYVNEAARDWNRRMDEYLEFLGRKDDHNVYELRCLRADGSTTTLIMVLYNDGSYQVRAEESPTFSERLKDVSLLKRQLDQYVSVEVDEVVDGH